jgi:hypothetical protein
VNKFTCPLRRLLKKSLESAGRNFFLPDHQANQDRQEKNPDDASTRAAFSTFP